MVTHTQLEVVTGCNLSCFYCLREDNITLIDLGIAKQIILDCEPSRQFWLQGYGEPALHPELGNMANFARSLGKFNEISTITNGKLALDYNLFDVVHFSCDSIDDTGSGKYLKLFEHNLALIDRSKVKLWFRIVDYGQDYKPLLAYCKANNIRTSVSVLDQHERLKDCYPIDIKPKYQSYQCTFTTSYRGYTIDGSKARCCHMRAADTKDYINLETFNASLKAGILPEVCNNCKFLIGALR